jgi:hypothetical protein
VSAGSLVIRKTSPQTERNRLDDCAKCTSGLNLGNPGNPVIVTWAGQAGSGFLAAAAAQRRGEAEVSKGISGNEFAVPGLYGLIAAGTAHGHLMIGGFEGSEAGEAGGVWALL